MIAYSQDHDMGACTMQPPIFAPLHIYPGGPVQGRTWAPWTQYSGRVYRVPQEGLQGKGTDQQVHTIGTCAGCTVEPSMGHGMAPVQGRAGDW